MTLFKQLEALVTGFDLNKNVQKLRLQIFGITSLLLLVLILSGAFISGGLVKNFITPQKPKLERIINNRYLRDDNLSNADKQAIENANIILNNQIQAEIENQIYSSFITAVLVYNVFFYFLLLIFLWILLYFTLKPFSNQIAIKEKFLQIASHDLRTPLSILYSDLSLGAKENDINILHKTIKNSKIEVKRLQNLADMYLSSLGNNDMASENISNYNSLNLTKELNDILVKLSSLNLNKIEVDYQLKDNILVKVADVNKFYQVLYNLVDNAFRHGKGAFTIMFEEGKLIFKNNTNSLNFIESFGLEICKSICDELNLEASFEVKSGFFIATIIGFVFE